MIAALGEATAQPFFINRLRDKMLSDPTGRRILRDKPRITSTTLDIVKLKNLPENTLGWEYARWLEIEGVSPDTRDAVRYIDDPEMAYVMQRYRECHDFYHSICGLPVIVEGEIALKWFEWANMGLPVAALSALFGPLRFKPPERKRLREIYVPWAVKNGLKAKSLITVYWEEQLERDANELREELGIEKPPSVREFYLQKESKASTEDATPAPGT